MGKKNFWGPPSNCKELIDGGRAYLREIPRDVAYREAIRLAKSRRPWGEVDGIFLLLTSWNSVYYRFHHFSPREIIERIDMLLRKISKTRQSLRSKKLETINLDNDLEEIESIFCALWKEEAIGCTGASKALHILYPQLFVPWDTDIRGNYHRRSHYRSHQLGSEKCYSAFMKEMHDRAVSLIRERQKEQICKECSNEFFTVDLPKAIDQYNFAKAKGL